MSEPQQPQVTEPAEYIDRWQVAVLESKLFVVEQEAKKSIRDLLRQNEELQIYKRAMESMAKQFIHPRMTALELAELQLKEQTPPCKSTSTTAN